MMPASTLEPVSRLSVLPALPLPADRLPLGDGRLVDGCGRVIDHLRLSVTSQCNLRCLYCRPSAAASPAASRMTDSQRLDLVRFLRQRCGLRQVRLTGGEPLLHPAILELVRTIRAFTPDVAVAMTTNAVRLGPIAADLRAAGLDRLNISLDTIDPRRYRELTGGPLAPVLEGIERALAVGFPPPKLNCVVLRGVNDDQLVELVRWAFDRDLEIRFLEAMPIGPAAAFNREHFVPVGEIRRRLAAALRLTPLQRGPGDTAARFTARGDGVFGTIGFISPVSESFCGQCRRIRVTAEGRLFPCLLDSRHVDLLPCWDDGGLDGRRLEALIQQAVEAKSPAGPLRQGTAMVTLGG